MGFQFSTPAAAWAPGLRGLDEEAFKLSGVWFAIFIFIEARKKYRASSYTVFLRRLARPLTLTSTCIHICSGMPVAMRLRIKDATPGSFRIIWGTETFKTPLFIRHPMLLASNLLSFSFWFIRLNAWWKCINNRESFKNVNLWNL